MDTNEIVALGYAVAMANAAVLTILLLRRWQAGGFSRLLAIAAGTTGLWAAVLASHSLGVVRAETTTVWVEWLRYFVWLVALVAILIEFEHTRSSGRAASRYGILILLVAGVPTAFYLLQTADAPMRAAAIAIGFLFCVSILGVTEQIFRNAPVDPRSGLNYFCVGVTGIFAYDFVLYVLAMADVSSTIKFQDARGFINALFAVPLAIGVWRRFRLSLGVGYSRQIIFYAFGLSAIGIYVAFTVIGSYYIRAYGGSWSDVAAIVFVVGAVALVAVLAVSPSTRGRVRVFLAKSFLQYKYDYRKEWLRFIATLSESGHEHVPTTAIRAVAQIVNSPGGIVWTQEQEGEGYVPLGSWRCDIPMVPSISGDSGLVTFLQARQWIVDLEEMKRHPARYQDLQLDDWLLEADEWWLIVPVELGQRLFGFILLQKPRVVPRLNFEDHDLLRTVGRHVGTHINQAETDRRLAESSQFGTYNRLSAFLMHDLNNLIAQQSLVVKNAERFRDNPEFVDDAISTIANSVSRMKRLMGQLSGMSKSEQPKRVDLRDTLTTAVERTRPREPGPRLDVETAAVWTRADPERLATVIEHLIRNAQESTDTDGSVTVRLRADNGVAGIVIADTGCGMSPEFLRERLFRPFDSTKGSQSMGIGAYQAREYVRTLGGQLEVTSESGVGTTFSIRLPIAD